jgi:hypothetical protein
MTGRGETREGVLRRFLYLSPWSTLLRRNGYCSVPLLAFANPYARSFLASVGLEIQRILAAALWL